MLLAATNSSGTAYSYLASRLEIMRRLPRKLILSLSQVLTSKTINGPLLNELLMCKEPFIRYYLFAIGFLHATVTCMR